MRVAETIFGNMLSLPPSFGRSAGGFVTDGGAQSWSARPQRPT